MIPIKNEVITTTMCPSCRYDLFSKLCYKYNIRRQWNHNHMHMTTTRCNGEDHKIYLQRIEPPRLCDCGTDTFYAFTLVEED